MVNLKETDRIKKVYALRKENIPSDRYSYFTPSHLYMVQSRERALLRALKSHGFSNLKDKRILDIGCGNGNTLRSFIQYGAKPENCFGIDLLPDRIETANRLSPNLHFICGDAINLPYDDTSFDIVIQYSVFTSILEDQMKKKVADEMKRVLKHAGIIIWYDFFMNNPHNPNVKGVKKNEIYSLFMGYKIQLNCLTLAPPLIRMLAPVSLTICYILENVPFLCTHHLGIINKEH